MRKIQYKQNRFYGQIKQNLITGYGVMHTPEFTYDGYFQHGEFHGLGALNVRNQYFYRGNFINGCFQNHGYLLYQSKNIEYEGEFITGQMHGFGRLTLKNAHFEGYFKQNAYHFGLLKTTHNDHPFKFLGTFQNNKPSSGTLWTELNGQKFKIQSKFTQTLSPGRTGYISTQRFKILFDNYQPEVEISVFRFLLILTNSSSKEISVAENGELTFSEEKIKLSVKKIFPNSAFYLGETVNLTPQNRGIFYFQGVNCLIGQFYNGFYQYGRTEFQVGNKVFVKEGSYGKLGKCRIQFLSKKEVIQFVKNRDFKQEVMEEKILEKLTYSVRKQLKHEFEGQSLPVVINYYDQENDVSFQGEISPKAIGQCKIKVNNTFIEASFSNGVLDGQCVLQRQKLFFFCQFIKGLKNGRAELRNGNFVYQYDYVQDVMQQLRLVNIETGHFIVKNEINQEIAFGNANGCQCVGQIYNNAAKLYQNCGIGYVFVRQTKDLRWENIINIIENQDKIQIQHDDQQLRKGFWYFQEEDDFSLNEIK